MNTEKLPNTNLNLLLKRLQTEPPIALEVARREQKLREEGRKIDFSAVITGQKTEDEIQRDILIQRQNVESRKKEWLAVMTGDQISGDATPDSQFYQMPQEEFFNVLKDLKNDLSHQVKVFNYLLDRWFNEYEHPPAYTAMRIAIILSKARKFDSELTFLSLYNKHFGHFPKSRTGELLEVRLGKKEEKYQSS